jgi:hypothetical protein
MLWVFEGQKGLKVVGCLQGTDWEAETGFQEGVAIQHGYDMTSSVARAHNQPCTGQERNLLEEQSSCLTSN